MDPIFSFDCVKYFENIRTIQHVEFSPNGYFLASSDYFSPSINLYNCVSNTFESQYCTPHQCGVGFFRFLPNQFKIIHATTREINYIVLLDVMNDEYSTSYIGHTEHITSLGTIDHDPNGFISGSMDWTICLWDVRTQHCREGVYLESAPIISLTSAGNSFAALTDPYKISVFDLRCLSRGPVFMYQYNEQPSCNWVGLQYSPDRSILLVNTDGGLIQLINALNGEPIRFMDGFNNSRRVHIEPSFTPSSTHIYYGSSNGKLFYGNVATGQFVQRTCEQKVMNIVKISPRADRKLLISAGEGLSFWKPFTE